MLALNTTAGRGSTLHRRRRHQRLDFKYTVAAGQSRRPARPASTAALTLNGGTIDDAVTNDPNPAVLTVATGSATPAAGGGKNIIDAVAPT